MAVLREDAREIVGTKVSAESENVRDDWMGGGDEHGLEEGLAVDDEEGCAFHFDATCKGKQIGQVQTRRLGKLSCSTMN